jgi:thiol:disulfide interchange protein DsbD
MNRIWGLLPLLLLPVLLLTAQPAHALESAPIVTKHATVTLVSESDAIEPGKTLRLGLRFRLAPGWHIYWSDPGDAGQPPELDLKLPPGAESTGFAWPIPERIGEQSVMTYAYTGEVLLPLTVTAGAGPLAVDGSASWLVCQKICVPEEGTLHLDLPAGPATPSAEAPLFAAADALMPRPSPFPAEVAPDGTVSISGAGLSRATVADAQFFPTASDAIENAAPQPVTIGDGIVSLALQPGPSFKADQGLAGVLVLRDPAGRRTGLSIEAKPGPPPAAAGLGRILVFAFLGGLILNLMPCVFPVLAMKALAIVRLSGVERRAVRAHAGWYTAGVLGAFGSMALLLLAVRAVWGFQFQSPAFVAAIAWLLFAVGLNLSGVYAVGGGVIGLGQGLADRGGHAGSFFTGLLAVLVATPCTAPFMGAAIAAALAAPAPVAVATFLTMGLGLAAPYAMLAWVPGLARFLPRPGRWMDVLKQALAFPMYAATAWLVWVMSRLGGADGVEAAASGLVLVGFAAWAFGIGQAASSPRGRWLGRAIAAASVLASIALLPGLVDAVADQRADAAPGEEPYSEARLASLRADGRPVFVNMTAAWCVTCLVNERVALSPPAVRDAFARRHVAYLKGDWTRADAAITRFLRAHDRDGVPLYLFYPPGDGAPTVLPQILTQSTVLDALNKVPG